MDRAGREGVIIVEESNTFGSELELTEGMQFDKGYSRRIPSPTPMRWRRCCPDDLGVATLHLFRFEDGMIVELWDFGQPVPAESSNADGIF